MKFRQTWEDLMAGGLRDLVDDGNPPRNHCAAGDGSAKAWGSDVFHERIRVAEGCDPHLVQAIEDFHDAIELRSRIEGRRLSAGLVANLCHHHLIPGLVSAVDGVTNASGAQSLIDHCASPHGIAWAVRHPRHLHQFIDRLCRFLRPSVAGRDEARLETIIDTLREVAFFVASWPRSKKVTAREDRGLRGGRQRLRSADERLWLAEWPYCELCWKLSQRAQRLERDAGQTLPGQLDAMSERFCADHVPKPDTDYWKAQEAKGRFRFLVRCIYEEMASNQAYRRRFISPEDEMVWGKIQRVSTGELEKVAARDLPSISALQMRVRHVAFEISRHLPRQIENAIQVASLQREAITLTGRLPTREAIGVRLGITKQAVSARMSRMSGFADFEAVSPQLRWWPFDGLDSKDAVRLRPAVKGKDQQAGWHSVVSEYLREIYPSLPSVNWRPIEVLKLAT